MVDRGGQIALCVSANTKALAEGLQRASESNARYYKRIHGHWPFKPGTQLYRAHWAMEDGKWRTLREIAVKAGIPETTVGSRIRDLRKPEGHEHVIRVARSQHSTRLRVYKMEEKADG